MNLEEKVNSYKEIGYKQADAVSKVAQDVVLLKISKSKYAKNITVKGGVVMHSISDDVRRATRDMDLDFIKYSLANDSIIRLIEELSNLNDGIKLEVDGDKSGLQDRRFRLIYGLFLHWEGSLWAYKVE